MTNANSNKASGHVGTPLPRRAYRLNEFCAAYGLSRSSAYVLIAEGKLEAVRVRGRRLITADSAERLLGKGE